jgi:hypothetical protein
MTTAEEELLFAFELHSVEGIRAVLNLVCPIGAAAANASPRARHLRQHQTVAGSLGAEGSTAKANA